MANLTALKRRATSATRLRGHDMKPWEDSEGKTWSSTDCYHCDAGVTVNINPMPNEIDIGGTAVALNCPHYEDGPNSKQHRRNQNAP